MNQIRSIEIGQVTHRNLLVNCEMRDPDTGWAYKNGGKAQFGYQNKRVYIDTYRKYQRESHCIWVLDDELINGMPIYEWARKMLIEWRLKEHAGIDTIAKYLTEAGIPTPNGRSAWSDSTVNCLMMPERLIQYAGYGTWNKSEYKNGRKRRKDRSEWKIIENAHQPIITKEEAEEIHNVREFRKPTRGKRGRRPNPYILTAGLLTCKNCGANFIGQMKHDVDYYLCGSHVYRNGADCDESWNIRCEEADNAIFDCIRSILGNNSDLTKNIVNAYNKRVDSQDKLYKKSEGERVKEIERLDGEISNLMHSVADGINVNAVKEEINSRIKQKNRLEAIDKIELPQKITVKEPEKQAAELTEVMKNSNPDKKWSIVRKYVANIEADPKARALKVSMYANF